MRGEPLGSPRLNSLELAVALLTTLLALAASLASLATLLTLPTTTFLPAALTARALFTATLLTATLILFTIVCHDSSLPLFEVFTC